MPKITALTALTSPSYDDLMYVVDDPGGATPVSKKVTIQNLFTGVVNVKQYGAVGNGVADDTAAIQAAITAGYIIIFPDGTYKTTATITIPAERTLYLRRCTITYTGASKVFNITGGNVHILGIGNGDWTYPTYGSRILHNPTIPGQPAITVGVKDDSFENCVFKDFYLQGTVNTSDLFQVKANFRYFVWDNVCMIGTAVGFYISGAGIHLNNESTVGGWPGDYSKIEGCEFVYCTEGIKFNGDNWSNGYVRRCGFESIASYGINVAGAMNGSGISFNTFYGCCQSDDVFAYDAAIHIQPNAPVYQVEISYNSFQVCGSSAVNTTHDIFINGVVPGLYAGYIHSIVIIGNQFNDTGVAGPDTSVLIYNTCFCTMINNSVDRTGKTASAFDIHSSNLEFAYINNTVNPRGLEFQPGGSTGITYNIGQSGQHARIAAAVPATGTWILGAQVWHTAPTTGNPPGWICTSSGTFSAATDNTGDTDGVTGTITGMTDTSDFNVGDYVTVSAGFATTGPFVIIAKTISTVTVNALSNAAINNVTVATPDPVFVAMANLA